MKNIQKLTVVAMTALLATAFPAAAATKAEVAKARAECASHKQRVKEMEGRVARGEGLAKAKAEWEAACQQAEVLINDLNGTKPPVVVPRDNS